MKKIFVSLCVLGLVSTSAFAADWAAADRVAPVGKILLEKNGCQLRQLSKLLME